VTGIGVEAAALTLFERIDAWRKAGSPAGRRPASAGTQQYLDRWCAAVAGGSAEVFERRLSWDGLSVDDVATALDWAISHPEEAALGGPDPGWFDRLMARLEHGARRVRERVADGVEVDCENPSTALLVEPLCADFRAALDHHEAVSAGMVGTSAVADLENDLRNQVQVLATPAARDHLARGGKTGGEERRWKTSQAAHGWLEFFADYPVLARQLERLLSTAATCHREMFDRLLADRDDLAGVVGNGREPGCVTGISTGLSDRHAGGRRVAILRFESGDRLVYKPRSPTMDLALTRWMEWLRGEGVSAIPVLPNVVPRDGYGWAEFVECEDVPSEQDVARWFESAGVLLAAAFALMGSDLHAENVVAGAESPVLVDVETFLSPELTVARTSSPDQATAQGRVAAWVRSSFLSSGLLTFLEERDSGRVVDIGGLCGQVSRWVDGVRVTQKNEPRVQGRPRSLAAHGGDVRRGFINGYRALMDQRARLTGTPGLSTWFDGAESRVLLRPTRIYSSLLNLWCEPRCQRSGLTIGPAMESLHRAVVRMENRPPGWDLAAEERRQLEGLDVPRFAVSWDGDTLVGSTGASVPGLVARSGREAAEARIRGLSSDDLEMQLRLLDLNMASLQGSQITETGVHPDAGDAPCADELSSESLKTIACDLGDQLLAAMVQGDEGGVLWLDPAHLRPEGDGGKTTWASLYNGAAGISVFLAALGRRFPGRGYRDGARRGLESVAGILEAPPGAAGLRHEPLGACNGFGGLVYAMVVASGLLQDTALARRALAGVGHITADRIAADQRLDVEGGAAGAILGLLALDSAVESEAAVTCAAACGRHLLHTRRPGPDGGSSWPSRDGRMLAGFAHGASGCALALARLWSRTGDDEFLQAAREALVFEDTLFDPELENWPVAGTGSPMTAHDQVSFTAWCHGAPGIALARASILETTGQRLVDDRLEAAIRTTRKRRISGVVNLCCGIFGGLDALMTVGQILERPELQRDAEERTAMAIRVAAGSGALRLGQESGFSRPGFFRGLAGIGYQLLRISEPGVHPSVLAFQARPRGAV
jgi:type 2 lantibiotic biosynthesis protein LanM